MLMRLPIVGVIMVSRAAAAAAAAAATAVATETAANSRNAIGTTATCAATSSSPDIDPKYTQPTRLIDSDHPAISELAQRLTGIAKNESSNDVTASSSSQSSPPSSPPSTEQAVVILHDYVRDNIAFGIPGAFYDMKASDVLQAKVGFCNTKVTLFNALVRSIGVPTRIRYVDLNAQVLKGLFDPGTSYVDHAITEVYINNQWQALDSYVVDTALAQAARTKLQQQGRSVGYGIHLSGRSDWNANGSAMIQAMPNQHVPNNIRTDWGYFDDNDDFYRRVPNANNRLNMFTALFIRLGASSINQAIDSVRSSSGK